MDPFSTVGAVLSGPGYTGLVDAARQTAGAAAPIPVGGGGFLDALGDVAGRVVDGLNRSESLSLEALSGADVDAREVADAVMSAEQSLQAAIAIRDKIVSAYLEVSRMAI